MTYDLSVADRHLCVTSDTLRDALALAEAVARDVQRDVTVSNRNEPGPAVVVEARG